MTAYSYYAPVMITYEGYHSLQVGNCECNIIFKKSQFISAHGSLIGAIDIQGWVQTVRFDRMTFSKTIAEHGVRFIPDVVYGNVLYVSGDDDTQHTISDGNDATRIGTESNPFQTVYTAVALSNPKKTQFVEKIVNIEEIITINIKAGIYFEQRMRIISERMTMIGEGIQYTFIRNDITLDEKTSCLISVEPDNTACKLDINDIAFEQQNYGQLGYDALIMILFGEFRIKQKLVALSIIYFSNGNFNHITAAVQIVSGGHKHQTQVTSP
ncbi:MAG: hypothetical protein EZS28_049400, partial [Streblomastix strix]